MKNGTLTILLRLDAAANLVGGIALIVAGPWLANPLGLSAAWLLRLMGVAFLVNGINNELVARRTATRSLTGLAAVDLVFAIAVFTIALADPTGAEIWARWAMAALASLTAAVGIVKTVAVQSLSAAPTDKPGSTLTWPRG